MRNLSLEVNGVRYPVSLHVERRRTVRASIGAKGVTIRVPSHLQAAERTLQVERLMAWATRRLAGRPVRRYEDGQELEAGGRKYLLRISRGAGSRSSARIRGGEITLHLSARLPPSEHTAAIGGMLSRSLARTHLPVFARRVGELNRRHFGVEVGRVSLRNTRATWGSCSPSGNLSFSTRLLLAPPEIVEYVCIHELAHRIVPSHSARFWRLVAQALPDCGERRRWLRRHGRELAW